MTVTATTNPPKPKTVLRRKSAAAAETGQERTTHNYIAWAKELRQAGATYAAIALTLGQAGYRRPQTKKPPHASDIYILVNGSKRRKSKPAKKVAKIKKRAPATRKPATSDNLNTSGFLHAVQFLLTAQLPAVVRMESIIALAKNHNR